jgi:glycosyltransferase involved in cell wall biosynthesis
MRIVLFSYIPDSRSGGMGNWTHQIADALRARGHEVSTWFADRIMDLGHGRSAVLLHPVVFTWLAVRARSRADAFIVHEPSGVWYGLLRRVWTALPPMTAMCHNVESNHVRAMDRAAANGLAGRRGRWRRLVNALARGWQSDATIRLADHVIVLSSIDREYVMQTLGRRAEDVTLLLNGVTPVQRGGDAPVAHSVLVVGGWLDVKGRRALPRLWRAVRTSHPSARLTIVGAGAPSVAVLQAFDARDRESIHVVPRVEGASAMRRFYAEHQIFLLPSVSEGGPLALLEAMSAGCAIVASRAGGVSDLAIHDESVLLYEPLDPEAGAAAIVSLLDDRARRERLGEGARNRAATLTWDDAAATLLAAVARSLGTNTGPWPSEARATIDQPSRELVP